MLCRLKGAGGPETKKLNFVLQTVMIAVPCWRGVLCGAAGDVIDGNAVA